MCVVEFLNNNQGVLSFLVLILFAVYILIYNMKRASKFIPCVNMILCFSF